MGAFGQMKLQLVLAITASAFIVAHAGVPLSQPAQLKPSDLSSKTEPPAISSKNGTSVCWLYRWRGMSFEDIQKQGIDWKGSVEKNWGSVAFSSIMLASSVALMFFGWLIGPLLFFFCGLICGGAGSYFLMDMIFNAANWSNCYVLGLASILGGIVAGLVFLKIRRLGCGCLGAAVGATLGYWFYGIALMRTKTTVVAGHDLLFWASILLLALAFGIVALHYDKLITIVATSVCGAFMAAIASDQLFFHGGHFNLSRVQLECVLHGMHSDLCPNGGSAEWSRDFYILNIGAILLAAVAILTQRRFSARRTENDGMPEQDVVYVQAANAAPRKQSRYYAV